MIMRFEEKLEKEFMDDYFDKNIFMVRTGLLLAAFLYAVFGILDIWIIPETKKVVWFIRYAVVCPLIIIVFISSYYNFFRKYMQFVLSITCFIAGLGIVLMIALAKESELGFNLYYSGLILVIIATYSLFRLRFIYAFLTSLLIVISYEIVGVFVQELFDVAFFSTKKAIFISNNFFFISANIIGMFAAYSFEFLTRKEFIQRRTIEVQKKQVEDNNSLITIQKDQIADTNAVLAEKNREMEQIISTTSHDLRSPLMNIQGYSELMAVSAEEMASVLRSKDIPGEIKEEISIIADGSISEYAESIKISTHKMNSLLNGIVKLSHTGLVEIKKEYIDMDILISDIAATIEFQKREAGANIEISKLPSCVGDRSQIDQLFSNIIGNALKYLCPDRSGIIKVSGYKEKERTVYCVEDNGIGIAPDNQKKIFGLFQQIDKKSTGEGIGLTIVHRILERHNGKIWIESEPGKESRFYISLPDEEGRSLA